MVKQVVFNPASIVGTVEVDGHTRYKVDITKAFKCVDIPAPEPDKCETATDERRRPLSEADS